MYAFEKNDTKRILKLLGNSSLKDDEKGAITAWLGFFNSLFQPGKDTFGCVWKRFLRVAEAVYKQEQSQFSLISLF